MLAKTTSHSKGLLKILGTFCIGLTLTVGLWFILDFSPPVEAKADFTSSQPVLASNLSSSPAEPQVQTTPQPERQQFNPVTAEDDVVLLERSPTGSAPLFASGDSLGGAPTDNMSLMTPPMPGDSGVVVGMTDDRVWGVVTPGATVTVTVNGAQMGVAQADGVGFFWTTLYDANGERPVLQGGDGITIYEDGTPVDSLTLRSIIGSIDVLNDTVSGTVDGLASSPVTLYPGFGEPNLTSYSQTTTTDGSGDFTADFSANWHFAADERVVVAYVDGDIEVHQMLYAQRLIVRPPPPFQCHPWSYGAQHLGDCHRLSL